MTTTTTSPVWYDEILVNGEAYPTRNPASGGSANSDTYLRGMTDDQREMMRAVHESAHAVATLAGGGYVHDVTTSTTAALRGALPADQGIATGNTRACNLPDGQSWAVFLGAGERAEDRWLRENGLWTPSRGAGVELGAYSDRKQLLAQNPHIGFGSGQDYSIVHDLADQLVSEHWGPVLAVAEALAARLHLTGREVSVLAGLSNGTHFPTCTLTD